MRCDGSGVKLIDKIKYRGSCPIVPMHPSPKQKRREEEKRSIDGGEYCCKK
jgi:hypothetical protein